MKNEIRLLFKKMVNVQKRKNHNIILIEIRIRVDQDQKRPVFNTIQALSKEKIITCLPIYQFILLTIIQKWLTSYLLAAFSVFSTMTGLMTVMTKYKISDVAEKIEIPVSTMKYFEKIGKLPKAQRDENNYRYYTEADILRIKAHFIPKIKNRNQSTKKGLPK